MTVNEKNITLVYSSDLTDARRKNKKLTQMEQFLNSVTSVRRNWSRNVSIFLVHTKPLNHVIHQHLLDLNVAPVRAADAVNKKFPIANKTLVELIDANTENIMFLDNDTIIHQPIKFDFSSDIMVSYDVGRFGELNDFEYFFGLESVDFPEGVDAEHPALSYYKFGNSSLFPYYNSGVYCIKKEIFREFCRAWRRLYLKYFKSGRSKNWSFYIEQFLFMLTIYKLKLNIGILPPGYNYICTPRNDSLAFWPKENVVIEHYAGNTSSPSIMYV